jgi:hypothetical protein
MILIDEESMTAIGERSANAKGIHGKYYAMVEVYHQLHCLNLLRNFIWRDHYKDDVSLQGPKDTVMKHIGKMALERTLNPFERFI